MRLTRYFAVAMIIIFCATAYLPAKAAGPDIPADKPLTVVKVEVVAGDEGSSVFYSDLNRWVIGPNGWVEWRITVEEKVSRAVGLIDLNPDATEHHQQAFAHFVRLEGNNTLVFRFTPNPHLQTYNLTPGRFITIWYVGVYILEKDKDGKEVEKYTREMDFRRISTAPQVFHKSGFPTYTISPSPEEVMIDGNFRGLMADQVMLDINDEILKPESLEFRYSWSGTQMSDWFQMKDRNPIDVPSEHRGKPVSLQLNVRDAVGNEIFKGHVYGGRQVNNTAEVTAEFYTVLAGREHFEPYTLLSMIDPNNRGTWDVLSDWGTLREDLENLIAEGMSAKDAVEYLKEDYRIRGYQQLRDLEEKYSEPEEYFSEEISIMLRPSPYYNPQYYSERNSRNRIDLAASGFQWSQNLYMDHIDYSIPLYPFKEEDIYPVWEKGGDPSGTYEGWRVVIPGQTRDEDYGIKDDGVYYLYILIADKRTSCSNNHIVFYNAHDIREKRVRGMSFVKLIKDTTPPVITFSEQDFDSKDFDVTIKVEDLGIRAAQYRINTPDEEGEFIDMPISEDGLTAEVTFNTVEIIQPSGRQDFTVEVRVLEKRHTPSETEWEGFWKYQYGEYNFNNLFTFYEDFYDEKPLTVSKDYFILSPEQEADINITFFGEKLGYRHLEGEPGQNLYLYHNAYAYEIDEYHSSSIYNLPEREIKYVLKSIDGSVIGGGSDWLILPGYPGQYSITASVEDKRANKTYECEEFVTVAESVYSMSAEFSTIELTNQNVAVTLRSEVPIGISCNGYTSEDYNQEHFISFDKNGEYTLTYKTESGYEGEKVILIGNIDKGFNLRHLEIFYSTEDYTNGKVTAYLWVGEEVDPGYEDGASYRNGWVSYTFENNDVHVFDVKDLLGNKLSDSFPEAAERTAEVSWIIAEKPDCEIIYDNTEITNKSVTAEIILPEGEGLEVVNNNRSTRRVFHQSGEFTFEVKDNNGIIHEFIARVDNIDIEPPVITLEGPLTYPTYQGLELNFVEPGFTAHDNMDGDVTDSVEVDYNIDIYKGGYQEIVYTVTDRAGNTAREVRGVSVYAFKGLNLIINGVHIRSEGEASIARGELEIDVLGKESDDYVLKYLPGRHKSGAFKRDGILISGDKVTINQPGWYTFYAQDRERKFFVGQVEIR